MIHFSYFYAREVNGVESKTWVREQEYVLAGIPVRIANHAPDRKSLLVVNTGDVAVSLGTRANLQVGGGIVLLPDGTLSLTERDDFALMRHEWYAVANGGAGAVQVWQTVLRQGGEQ